ncbi:hypothetical protein [Streptomyces otsuchiensis]|uniref:SCO2584 family spore wall biosynthesis protein n=1 Tax=Streptomyces otsuchiensis TaxID=2681388 RepID=UPI00103274AC|nr:hypothetical protein [Streptomyces otsuchiensis]
MPDDVGGPPFPDGEGPESSDRGAADEAFAAVVLDEAFVEAARIHEPSARERLLYAGWDGESDGDGDDGQTGALFGGYDSDAAPGAHLFDEPYEDEGRFDSSDHPRDAPERPAVDGHGTPPGWRSGPADGRAAPAGEAGRPGAPGPAGRREAPSTAPAVAAGAPAGTGANGRRGPGGGVRAAAAAGRRPGRWQRPVACVLAMVMGLTMVAFALIAVQRAGSGQPIEPPSAPPASDPGGDGDGAGTDAGPAGETGTAAGPSSSGGARTDDPV